MNFMPKKRRRTNFLYSLLPLFIFILSSNTAFSQTITGKVKDEKNNPLIGAYVIAPSVKGVGAIVAENGEFSVKVSSLPINLKFSFSGYKDRIVKVTSTKKLNIILESNENVLTAAVVKASRVTEKQKEAPLTVESMGLKAIQDAPAASFYESLGALKGVDVTAASLGFRVVNTRGFNSTSPVRSLQLIDGVDNQSPGLNFSLGNFLGASDIDIRRVDIIAGASSAFYGPNAFNGVISMETKSPFDFTGITAELKYGERNLMQYGFRYADYITNKEGKKKLGFKINALYMQANDWEAENYNPSSDSEYDSDNPGGYDAVNIYGDEIREANNDYSESSNQLENPGLGYFYRTGYRETDLVNYNTDNLKLNSMLSYRISDSVELSYNFNWSGGSTVYQGDNRYKLENIRFWQNRIELAQKGKYFIRFYSTNEDAGDSYDVVTTAFRLNEASKTNVEWNRAYTQNWRLYRFRNQVQGLPGYPTYNSGEHGSIDNWAKTYLQPFLNSNADSLNKWHGQNRNLIDAAGGGLSLPRYEPGTAEFDSAFADVTGRLFTDNGTRFYDKSALYHGQAEYKFKPEFGIITVGGSGRLYAPQSRGTILEDTGSVVIRNHEFGVYAGLDKRWRLDRVIMNTTIRVDKNKNFNFLVSPAASLIYKYRTNHVFRTSFSAAIRNPTLADQYLYYDVGRATLLGNLNGYDSLIDIESFNNYRSVNLDINEIKYFNVAPIKPEKARTFEIGYKGSVKDESIFIDAGYYLTFYKDFIGYNIGLDADFDPVTRFPVGGINAYRVAANATSSVTTQGLSVSVNYYHKKLAYGVNYSYNVLNKKGTDDPIIPAFNTPKNKFNLSLSGSRIKLPLLKGENFGFGINYKWIEGFVFEGSPQFTGFVPTYDMVDAQINYNIPKWNTTLKIGASNILGLMPLFDAEGEYQRTVFNNANYQVYGGPFVGRMAYFSVLTNINTRKK